MALSATNSFGTRDKLSVGAQSFDIYRLEHLERQSSESMARLPYSLRILLENLLRNEDARFVHKEDIQALANWTPKAAEKASTRAPTNTRASCASFSSEVQPRSSSARCSAATPCAPIR
jgi:aconitase A